MDLHLSFFTNFSSGELFNEFFILEALFIIERLFPKINKVLIFSTNLLLR